MEIKEKFRGTCSAGVEFNLSDEGKITNVRFQNGCSGNLQAIARFCEGLYFEEVVEKLRGISCGSKTTSCGDQFAKALERTLTLK